MPRDFKYDVIQLINNVKERPCIWDKSLESHKDRIERRAAWEEVFSILEPHYIEMSSNEKKATGDHIVSKWTNMRDAFVKSLKSKFGKPKKTYVLYHQLKFLLKVLPTASEHTVNNEEEDYSGPECHEESTMTVKYENNIEECDYSITECNEESITPVKYENNVEKPSSRGNYNNRKRRVRDLEDETNIIPKIPAKEHDTNDDLDYHDLAVEVENDPRIMNEDEAFFASLLPSVVRYTEDERLEFRIEVLALMRKIKENRNWIIGS